MQHSEPSPSIQPIAQPDAMASDAIPKHTTPTWESELLLSGATVFGLLQVPSWLHALIDRLHNELPVMWDTSLLLGSIFSLAVVYGLIITFLLHLATRAYWVALVGLRSVYPQGIRWERHNSGPIGKRVQQGLYGDQDALIERADNASTLVFSTGIAIVFTALLAVMTSIPVLLLATAMQTWVLPLRNPATWFLVAMAVVVVPLLLPRLVDRVFGNRLSPEGRFATALARIQKRTNGIGPWRMAKPLMLNLITNMHSRYGFAMFLLLTYALFAGVTTSEEFRRKHLPMFELPALSRVLPQRQLSDYYENSRADSRVVPHIQADIVTEPYLRLWVPLDPDRSRAFMRSCGRPDSNPTRATATAPGAPEQVLAACLGSVVAPTLDGRPIINLAWHFYRDEALGIDGLHAYIPVQQLANGEHELLLAVPARDDAQPGDKPESWRIPFWR